jgi:hypothetical protein
MMKNASTGAFASEKQRRTEKMAEGITQDETGKRKIYRSN